MFAVNQQVTVEGRTGTVKRAGDGWATVRWHDTGFNGQVDVAKDGTATMSKPMMCMVPQSQRRGR